MVLDYLWGQKESFEVVDKYKHDKPKTIVISFDGSGQEPANAVQSKSESDEQPLYTGVGGISNVCKLHLIAGGNIGCSCNYFEDQLPLYYSGVGTRGSEIGQLIRNIPGFSSGFAMDYIAELAWKDLEKVYNKGDKVFIFGFSRGAATARLFISYLSKNPCKGCDKVDFLGVFDTVVESLKYSLGTDIKNLDFGDNVDSSLPDIVKRAVHFCAIDEYRYVMDPTLFNDDPKNRVTEIWCPGCHSDVGGGYYHDGISDTVLNCMMIEAKKAGLKCREITEEMCKNEDDNIVKTDPPPTGFDVEKFKKFDKDMKIEPDGLDPDIHDEYQGGFAMPCLNWINGFEHRKIVVMKDDKPSDKPILLLDIAVERAKKFKLDEVPPIGNSYGTKKYRPEHLKGVKYRVVNSKDMSVSDEVYVIEDQVEW